MPIIQNGDNISIIQNEAFYTTPKETRGKNSFLNNCRLIGSYQLTQDDYKKLDKLYPGFSLRYFNTWLEQITLQLTRGKKTMYLFIQKLLMNIKENQLYIFIVHLLAIKKNIISG